ncbi:MAG: site-specific integrase [Clostridiales bacterium]|nr:site-specific integrase [Clostridiales bacterium]
MKYKKRKDGRYCKQILVGYKDNGSRIMKTIYAKTIRELEQKEVQLRNEINQGKVFINDNITFGAWSEKWLETYKRNVSNNTYLMYKNCINNHIIPSIGKIQLSKLKPIQIQKGINDILEEGKIRTAEIFKATVKQIVNQAIAEGFITNNVCSNLQKIKKEHTEKRTLSDFELKCIKNTKYTDKEKLFLDIMYYTGLRRGEVLALTVSSINKENHTLTVSQSLDISQNTPIIKEPKSKAGYRDIPIPDNLYNELVKYISSRKTLYIFTSQNGSLVTRSSFRKMWESIMKKTIKTADEIIASHNMNISNSKGIEFTPHIFRHTYATNLYYAGIDIKTAQYLLGHSSLDMTLKIYTHLDNEQTQTIAKEKIQDFFSQSKVSQL